jgi:hypothetical protein
VRRVAVPVAERRDGGGASSTASCEQIGQFSMKRLWRQNRGTGWAIQSRPHPL